MKKLKKKNGFTLIELLVSMAIFGFLAFVITSILIVVVNTVSTIDNRSFLRTNIEAALSQITQDVQFSTDMQPCTVGSTTCFSMIVPSFDNTSGTNGILTKTEKISLTTASGLSSILKSVTINGSVGSFNYYLTPGVTAASARLNLNVTNFYFSIGTDDILVSITGELQDQNGNVIKDGISGQVIQQTLSTNILFNRD